MNSVAGELEGAGGRRRSSSARKLQGAQMSGESHDGHEVQLEGGGHVVVKILGREFEGRTELVQHHAVYRTGPESALTNKQKVKR